MNKTSCTTSIKNEKKQTQIQKNNKQKNVDISVAILSAGIGSRIKSYEPRSLLKINDSILIDHQINVINSCFADPEIIGVFGYNCQRIVKKLDSSIRVVENQLYDETNVSESLRLAFNNMNKRAFLIMHGDLIFNKQTIYEPNYNKSFIIIDTQNHIESKEVGVTVVNNKATIFSYGLDVKWCQMAFVTGKELRIMRQIFNKFENSSKKMLSFEILNKIIENGGTFECHEPHGMKIMEIDRIRKGMYEDFNF